MIPRTVALGAALVVVAAAFFGLVFLFADDGDSRAGDRPVLSCDANPPVPEDRLRERGVTPYGNLSERYRQAFRDALDRAFLRVDERTRRYFANHPRIRYRREIYLCETGRR